MSHPRAGIIHKILNSPAYCAFGHHRLHWRLQFHGCQALLQVQVCQNFDEK